MNCIEFIFSDCLKNIKSNKKIMFAILVVCILSGVVLGSIHVHFYEQSECDKEETSVPFINISTLTKDETYYYKSFYKIKNTYNILNMYVEYLNAVDMTGTSLTELNDYEEKLISYDSDFKIIDNYYFSKKPMIIENKKNAFIFIDDNIDILKEEIQDINREIEVEKETAVSSINYSDEKKKKITIEKELDYWKEQKESVRQKNSSENDKINKRMDELLSFNIRELNDLIASFNNMISTFEKREQYDIIYNPYLLKNENINITDQFAGENNLEDTKEKAIIYARSVAGVDNKKEHFFSIVAFFAMFGMALSALYGCIKNR